MALDRAMPFQSIILDRTALQIAQRRVERARQRVDPLDIDGSNKVPVSSVVRIVLYLTSFVRILFSKSINSREECITELAESLSALRNRLLNVGRHEEALKVSTEVLRAYGALRSTWNKMYRHHLAEQLTHHAGLLLLNGNTNEALDTNQKAIKLYGDSTSQNEAAASTALMLKMHLLSSTGQHGRALKLCEKAIRAQRRLATGKVEQNLELLANLLTMFSTQLLRSGRLGDSLAAIKEAVGIRRQICAKESVPSMRALGASLLLLSQSLSALRRQEEALAACEEFSKISANCCC